MDNHEIVSRSEAKARGLKTYFTGKPCPHGHVALRQTSNGRCRECAYDRTSQWRKQNWERKLRKYNRRYHADYYARNRLAVMVKRREYYQSNKPMVLHRTRERRLRDQIDPQGAAERRLKRIAECITDWMDD